MEQVGAKWRGRYRAPVDHRSECHVPDGAPVLNRLGLVNEVVPASDLIARAEAILKKSAPIAARFALAANTGKYETPAARSHGSGSRDLSTRNSSNVVAKASND